MSARLRLLLVVVSVAAVAASVWLWLPGDPVEGTVGESPVTAIESSERRATRRGSTASERGTTQARATPAVFAPAAKAIVSGRVVTSDGVPAGAALVAVEQVAQSPDGSTRVVATTTADGQGVFRFELSAGPYVLLATRDGLASDRTATLELAPGGALDELVLVLEPGASLELTVRDQSDGHSLSSCRAQGAGSLSGVCDHAGRIRLGPLAPGPLALRVTAPGYAPAETSVLLARRGRLTAELTLARGAIVKGRVVDPERQPVAGALVRSSHYALGGVTPPQVTDLSNADGVFVLDGVAPGRVRLLASAPGWADASSAEFVLTGGDEKTGLLLELTTGGAVEGRVLDAGRRGMEGAHVEALRLVDKVVAGTDVSTSDGHFRLDGLQPGSYTLTASVGQARAVAQGVEVQARDERSIELVLGGDALTGTVEDAAGAPVAGARVTAVSQHASGLGEVSTTSDGEGRFTFEALSGAPYRVSARAQGRGGAEVRGLAAGAHARLVLEGTGRLEGSVVSQRGQSLESFELTVKPSGPVPQGGVAGRYRVLKLLSPDGGFAIEELPAGMYEVRAEARDHMLSVERVEITSDRTSRVDLRLSTGVALVGRVLRGEVPVAGCRVMDRTTTGSDGTFRLAGLPPMRMFVWVRCGDGEGGAQQVQLTQAAETSVEIQVRPLPSHAGSDEFGGIGASLRGARDGRTFVMTVFEGSPAFYAGVRARDEIVSVDGWPAHGHSVGEVVERIRGPLGQPVVLELRRPPEETPLRVVAERSRIVTN